MRRADIEVPNPAVDVNSWAGSACYPRGSFYPLIHASSTRTRRVTKPWFPTCSARLPHSQAPLCLYTLRSAIPYALREPLGASVTVWEATAPVKLPACRGPPARFRARGEPRVHARVVFHRCLPRPQEDGFAGSHLCYAGLASRQRQGGVKLHGVFLSCHRTPESARALQFRRVLCRDSAQLVTPFVRVGTYPTRNFATLGRL